MIAEQPSATCAEPRGAEEVGLSQPAAPDRGPLDPRTWLADPWLLGALVFGLLLRLFPLVMFPETDCQRDECIYRNMAFDIVGGKGLTLAKKGWLPVSYTHLTLPTNREV